MKYTQKIVVDGDLRKRMLEALNRLDNKRESKVTLFDITFQNKHKVMVTVETNDEGEIYQKAVLYSPSGIWMDEYNWESNIFDWGLQLKDYENEYCVEVEEEERY